MSKAKPGKGRQRHKRGVPAEVLASPQYVPTPANEAQMSAMLLSLWRRIALARVTSPWGIIGT
jgi:hypothetical protein